MAIPDIDFQAFKNCRNFFFCLIYWISMCGEVYKMKVALSDFAAFLLVLSGWPCDSNVLMFSFLGLFLVTAAFILCHSVSLSYTVAPPLSPCHNWERRITLYSAPSPRDNTWEMFVVRCPCNFSPTCSHCHKENDFPFVKVMKLFPSQLLLVMIVQKVPCKTINWHYIKHCNVSHYTIIFQ